MDNPNDRREAAPRAARVRREDLSGRFRDAATRRSVTCTSFPVDALKIDRSFVKSLLLPDRPAIVESILALARTLNTSVVAEGIESEVQARELERLGCTHAQGYLFSRPLSTQAVEELLVANQPLGPKRTESDVVAAATDAVPVHSSTPFEWPAHIPVRPVPAAAAHASAPHVSGETLRA